MTINLLTRYIAALLLPIALIGIQVSASTPAAAASITGQWGGKGTVKLKSGSKEQVRCRVEYGRVAGQRFSVKAKCATGSGRIDQSGELTRVSKNRYVGNVRNEQFNVSAKVVITVNGRRQNVSISSNEGSATIGLIRR